MPSARSADPASIAVLFNDCINGRNVEALTHLMTDDHTFIDTEGNAVSGRLACRAAWEGFFEAFPRLQQRLRSGNRRRQLGHHRGPLALLRTRPGRSRSMDRDHPGRQGCAVVRLHRHTRQPARPGTDRPPIVRTRHTSVAKSQVQRRLVSRRPNHPRSVPGPGLRVRPGQAFPRTPRPQHSPGPGPEQSPAAASSSRCTFHPHRA
jgi:hypothetical protein